MSWFGGAAIDTFYNAFDFSKLCIITNYVIKIFCHFQGNECGVYFLFRMLLERCPVLIFCPFRAIFYHTSFIFNGHLEKSSGLFAAIDKFVIGQPQGIAPTVVHRLVLLYIRNSCTLGNRKGLPLLLYTV